MMNAGLILFTRADRIVIEPNDNLQYLSSYLVSPLTKESSPLSSILSSPLNKEEHAVFNVAKFCNGRIKRQ